jgi:hypothetical protein
MFTLNKWKLLTFSIGFVWLLYGALYMDYPDWDVGVSITMSLFSLAFAQFVWESLRDRKYKQWPICAVVTWWCVDGSYTLYWSIVNPSLMIREGQWLASLCLFLLCGAVWSFSKKTIKPSADTTPLSL